MKMNTFTLHHEAKRFVRTLFFVVLISAATQISARAQSPVQIPQNLTASDRASLSVEKAGLNQWHEGLVAKAVAYNSKCATVPANTPLAKQCREELASLENEKAKYYAAVKKFNNAVTAAKQSVPAPSLPAPNPVGEPVGASSDVSVADMQAEDRRIIDGMTALAKRLGWSADEQSRLVEALNKLDYEEDTTVTPMEIKSAWNDILKRGQTDEFTREASQGEGPGFPGAGKQTRYNDCAVFALANAAGLPYGVAATRATELIREGDWRRPSERSNPQRVIEQHGLNGGEVVMLAEAFGRAKVVPSTEFPTTLREGHPVLVGLAPYSGRGATGHEVVLTKAFQHGGESWYEMMDSNQGPQRRLYLSASELHTVIRENGVAFEPDPGRTPKLLRTNQNP